MKDFICSEWNPDRLLVRCASILTAKTTGAGCFYLPRFHNQRFIKQGSIYIQKTIFLLVIQADAVYIAIFIRSIGSHNGGRFETFLL